jgi:uncharacterized coiled-coil DUF342 family protein
MMDNLANSERSHNEAFALRAEIDRLRAERDEAHREIAKLMVALEQLRAALRDLVNRWSTERGFDSAIARAHHALGEKP